jgi:Kelch motif
LPHDTQPEIFDPLTNTWSNWTLAPTPMCYACFVSWKNYIFKFGGLSPTHSRQVQRYDSYSHKWTTLLTYPPFDIYRSGCVTLPNGNILIVGSMATSVMAYSEYNVRTNVWSPIIVGRILQHESTPLVLGRQVFVIPSLGPKPVEVYNYKNSTVSFSAKDFNITTSYKPAVVAVPARWFSDLPGGCLGIK